jgi:hypothetical protein
VLEYNLSESFLSPSSPSPGTQFLSVRDRSAARFVLRPSAISAPIQSSDNGTPFAKTTTTNINAFQHSVRHCVLFSVLKYQSALSRSDIIVQSFLPINSRPLRTAAAARRPLTIALSLFLTEHSNNFSCQQFLRKSEVLHVV